MDYKQPGGFGYLLGCVLVFFFLVFRSFLFLVARLPVQASRFLMITGVGARISGLLFLFRGFVQG